MTESKTKQPQPKPLATTVPVAGLTRPYTILHVTDLHACALDEAEAATMTPARRDYIPPRVGLFSGGRPYPSEAALPVLFDYAAEVEADLLLLTGDILDFPSETNLSLLTRCMEESRVPTLYITGNHDWSFADDYHTGHAAEVYLPRIGALCGGDPHFTYVESDALIVCGVDDSCDRVRSETVDAYMALARHARAVGKPLVLSLHVPLHAETLVEDTVRVWGRELCIGEGALGDWDAHTVRFWREVAVNTDYAPAAVIAGHVHFNHEDRLPNGVPQYITRTAEDGHCRLLHLVPCETRV